MTRECSHAQLPARRQAGRRHGALARRSLLALLAVSGLLALLAPVASADFSFGSIGAGAGQLFGGGPVAVSRQSGDVYVADSINNRVDQFESDGTFVRAFGWGVQNGAAEPQECTTATGCRRGFQGSGAGQLGENLLGIAVDNDPGSVSYGDLYVIDASEPASRVDKFSPEGNFLLAFGGGVRDGAAEAQTCGPEATPPTATCHAGVEGTGDGEFVVRNPYFDWTINSSIALGPGGTVYVASANRIQEFSPGGEYTGQVDLPPAPAGENDLATALAVDDACAQQTPPLTDLTTPTCAEFDPSDGDLYVHRVTNPQQISARKQVPGVQKLSPAGTVLETLDVSGTPESLAPTEAGDLIVGDASSSAQGFLEAYEFLEYTPTGRPLAIFSSPEVVAGAQFLGGVGAIAVSDAAKQLYAANSYKQPSTGEAVVHVAAIDLPQSGPPTITPGSEHATQIEPSTATLNAVVNAAGHESEVRFQYLSARKYAEDGNTFGAGTEETSKEDIGLLIHERPIAALASGLSPETAYRFRAVIKNDEGAKAEGETTSFTTRGPVTIEELTTQTVAPELVTLKAQVDPNGARTEYAFQYGPDTSYAGGTVEGSLPISTDPSEVSASFEHLSPDTTYHYRLTAHNSFGHVEAVGGTFTTEPSPAQQREAEECPENGTVHGAPRSRLREEDESLALPECRAYEMVSPPAKGGYSVKGNHTGAEFSLAPSGERVLFTSNGAFAGAGQSHSIMVYLAHRTGSGWQSGSAMMPVSPTLQTQGPEDFTSGLDRWLVPAEAGSNFLDNGVNATSGALYLGADSGFIPATPKVESLESGRHIAVAGGSFAVVGSAADLSRLYIRSSYPLLAADPIHSFLQEGHLYEASGIGGPSPQLTFVADLPAALLGTPGCAIDDDIGQNLNIASADGSTLFYSSPLAIEPGESCGGGDASPNKAALFAHVGEAPPLQIAPPPAPYASWCHSPAPCFTAPPASAHFYGASPAGSRVWFTTTQPLIDADTDTTADLYLAKLENGQVTELIQASAGDATDPHPGAGAGVQGVLGVSADGGRASFVATGVLTTHENALHQSAEEGADNLYLYDADATGSEPKLKFVARLCSGPEESGSVRDPACPAQGEASDARLWTRGINPEAQLTPDGRYLLFSTYARLIEAGPEADTDNARDVYRYDFQSGQILRVSIARNGNDANGNDSHFDASIGTPSFTSASFESQEGTADANRAITADGSTVVFSTSAPLASPDTNEAPDVYEWHEGQVSLISDGLDPLGVQSGNGASDRALISASGRDITFITARRILPATDTDNTADVYDARIGGGFPQPSPPPPVCEGAEACHAKATEPTLTPAYTSEETHNGGNGLQPVRCAKGRRKVKKHGQVRCVPSHHKKHHQHKKQKRATRANRRAAK